MKTKKGLAFVINIFWILIIIGAAILLVKGVGPKLSFIGNGETTFSYTQQSDSDPLFIGDKEFKANTPRYSCKYIGEKVKSEDTDPRCWSTKISYADHTYTIYSGQSISLNEYLTVHFDVKAQMYSESSTDPYIYRDDQHWTSFYTFSLNNFELTSEIDSSQYYYELNSDEDLLHKIQNDLASFDVDHAGAWVRPKHSLLERGEQWTQNEFPIQEGTISKLIPVDTSELGKVQYEFQPYIIIEADGQVIIKQKNPVMIEYEIVKELPKQDANKNPSRFSLISYKILSSCSKVFKHILGWFS